MPFAVHYMSHWQGARNPGARVAVFEEREAALALAGELSTCSFCTPGRTGGHSVGSCYRVYRSDRAATDRSVSDALRRMRDERDE